MTDKKKHNYYFSSLQNKIAASLALKNFKNYDTCSIMKTKKKKI